jgi:peptide-methionine (S)-S-oxide reductase
MRLQRLQADVSGVSKQFSKESKGVKSVLPGYSGGTTENPSYDDVCGGNTGHAESVQIVFDPKVITFKKILEIFWNTHDPTTLNRQGNDVGTQYRSAIFFKNQKQKETAEKLKAELDNERIYTKPIITEISPLRSFYAAEEYHRNYYDAHKDTSYCNIVINPKIASLLKKYKDDVKE